MQVVEPDARQLGLLRHAAEVPANDVVQVQRLPVGLTEDQVQVGVGATHLALDGVLLSLQVAQHLDHSGQQVHDAPGGA